MLFRIARIKIRVQIAAVLIADSGTLTAHLRLQMLARCWQLKVCLHTFSSYGAVRTYCLEDHLIIDHGAVLMTAHRRRVPQRLLA